MEQTGMTAILIMLLFIETGFIIMLFGVGGKLLKAKVKALLPWYKNKGRFWLHLYKTGTFVLDYVKLDKENKIKRKKEHDILITGTNKHSFIDKTAFEDYVTIHKLDRQPLVLSVEGGPTDILAKYRDYEQDLSKLTSIENYIQNAIDSDDLNKLRKAKTKIINLFYNFKKVFKYLPVARQYANDAISMHDDNKVYNDQEIISLLTRYKTMISHIKRELNDRNNRFVNFEEFFHAGNMASLMNKIARESIQIGRASMGSKNQAFDQIVKIATPILLIALAVVGYLLVDQGNKIEDIGNKIDELSNNLTVGDSTNTDEEGTSPPSSPVASNDQNGEVNLLPNRLKQIAMA